MMFRITRESISGPLIEGGAHVGAVVVFEGRVRDLNEGLRVHALEYEAMDALAIKEGERILVEAMERFALSAAACEHRVGRLEIGEVAIRVEAAGMHRQEAFDACRYIVDEVKARVPIWKKELYENGASEWVNCAQPSDEGGKSIAAERAYYSRQTRLPDLGEQGQQRLRDSRVLVVGAGGLGSSALLYLAAAGVGKLGVCDFDELDLSNLHRQVLYVADDSGKTKVFLAAERLRALNPHIEVATHKDRLHEGNVAELLDGYDVVLDCTDNFASKFVLNDACVWLGRPLVQASIYQYEGQLLIMEPGSEAGCLRCLWPSVPASACVGSCAEVGVLGAVPGVLGSMQAMETLNLILGLSRSPARDHLVLVDLLSLQTSHIRRRRNADCPVCGGVAEPETLEVATVDALPHCVLVDIRETEEGETIPNALRIPMSVFHPEDARLAGSTSVVLVCAHGVRSYVLASNLRDMGRRGFYSLAGGVSTLSRHR